MKKSFYKIIILTFVTASVMSVNVTQASETSGGLSTGFGHEVTGTINGFGVLAPEPTPTPSTGGGGGGGGGSSSGGGGGGSSGASSPKGDSNHDGKVNILDFVTLMANWGKTGYSNLADFNGDNKVDILDFVLLMANWTK